MGKYDEMPPEELRERLVRFGRLILKLDDEGELLEKAPQLLKIIGDLRQMLFAYEVRCTARLGPEGHEADGEEQSVQDDPALLESLRVVEEALEREKELLEEITRDPPEDPEED